MFVHVCAHFCATIKVYFSCYNAVGSQEQGLSSILVGRRNANGLSAARTLGVTRVLVCTKNVHGGNRHGGSGSSMGV